MMSDGKPLAQAEQETPHTLYLLRFKALCAEKDQELEPLRGVTRLRAERKLPRSNSLMGRNEYPLPKHYDSNEIRGCT